MDIGFPNVDELKRIKELRKYQNLYDGDHYKEFGIKDYFVDSQEIEKKLYIAINLCSLISEYFADLTIGDNVYFEVKDKTQQGKIQDIANNNSLSIKIFECAITQSEHGFSVLRVRKDRDTNQIVIEEIPVDQYFPKYSKNINGTFSEVDICSYVDIKQPNGKTKEFLYNEHYYIQNGQAYLQYKLWELDSFRKVVAERGIQIYDATLPVQPVDLQINRIPIFQINNIKNSKNTYGKSDYKDVLPQLEEINNRLTQISVQLIKHLNAKMAVPFGVLDEKGSVKVKDIEVIEVEENGVIPQYITNTNPQIENAFKQIDKLLQTIAAITKIPPDVLGLEGKGGAEKVEAMKIRLFNTTRKVLRKRLYFEQPLRDLLSLALIMGGISAPQQIAIKWDDVLPQDESIFLINTIEKVSNGFLSKKSAMRRLENWDQETINKELEEIANEKAEAMKLNQAMNPNPPKFELNKNV